MLTVSLVPGLHIAIIKVSQSPPEGTGTRVLKAEPAVHFVLKEYIIKWEAEYNHS